MKAFLVNRVADFGFLIGIASLFIFLDTLSINEIINQREYLPYFNVNFLGMSIDALTFANVKASMLIPKKLTLK